MSERQIRKQDVLDYLNQCSPEWKTHREIEKVVPYRFLPWCTRTLARESHSGIECDDSQRELKYRYIKKST